MAIDKVYPDVHHLAEILHDYIENPQQILEQSYNARKKIEENDLPQLKTIIIVYFS